MHQEPTILLVDDAAFNLKILKKYLKNEPYTIDTASNGEDALQKLRDAPSRYMTVLMELIMPIMGGMDALQEIKRDKELKHIPVIFQTAKSNKEDVLAGLEAGAHYYLTKPFSHEELITVVRAAVHEFQQSSLLRHKLERDAKGLVTMTYAEFTYKNLTEADNLASVLASACPNPHNTVTGLSELFINAVEHGNLGITYDEKTELCNHGSWHQEVESRLLMPEYADKIVKVKFRRDSNMIRIKIIDEGNGFDWKKYLQFEAARAYDTHGRGIATATQMCFDQVEYSGKGNVVEVSIVMPKD